MKAPALPRLLREWLLTVEARETFQQCVLLGGVQFDGGKGRLARGLGERPGHLGAGRKRRVEVPGRESHARLGEGTLRGLRPAFQAAHEAEAPQEAFEHAHLRSMRKSPRSAQPVSPAERGLTGGAGRGSPPACRVANVALPHRP